MNHIDQLPDELIVELIGRSRARLEAAQVSQRWYPLARKIDLWIDFAKQFGFPLPRIVPEDLYDQLRAFCIKQIPNDSLLQQLVFPIRQNPAIFSDKEQFKVWGMARNRLLAWEKAADKVGENSPMFKNPTTPQDVSETLKTAEAFPEWVTQNRLRLRHNGALSLTHANLTEFPMEIFSLESLSLFRLSDNFIRNIPLEITQWTRLEALHLNKNQLTAFPEAVLSLTQLKSLHLQNNHIAQLPNRIGELTQLQTLNVAGNQLKIIPEAISSLVKLRQLRIESNFLKALPAGLEKLTRLESLYLDEHLRSALPAMEEVEIEFFISPAAQEVAKAVQIPDIWGCVCREPYVEKGSLDLSNLGVTSDNLFITLFPFWDLLGSIRVLSLHSNQLTSIPAVIINLSHLRALHLQDNLIASLPEKIGKLSRLETLNVAGNQLSSIPKAILSLKRLRQLRLDGNPLQTLPEGFERLEWLEQMTVDKNLAHAVPERVRKIDEEEWALLKDC